MTATARPKTTRRDYLAVVEAAYDLGASEADWTQGIADALHPIVDAGFGTLAYTYDASDLRSFRIGAFAQAGGAVSLEDAARIFPSTLSLAQLRNFYSASPPTELASRIFAASPPSEASVKTLRAGPSAIADALGVRGHNPDGWGCVVSAPSPTAYPLFPKLKRSLDRVALHLAAAFRLRSKRMDATSDSDAIFSEVGRLEHLRAPSAPTDGNGLEEAVGERLVGRRLRSEKPERALELWRALVAGRWSLVDHVDTDGKRFILARRNDPNLTHPAALEHDERLVALYTSWGHSNKLMSYELGLAPSTISTLLRSALRKLRVRSRSELMRLFSPPGAK